MNSKLIVNLSIWLFLLTPLQLLAQLTDIDGNKYKTVKIGTQTWMAENLNVSHFRNGDPIPEVKTNYDWKKAAYEGKPAWCYYKNENNYSNKYGKLYNWYAVIDPRGLAPEGWKVPILNDFEGLFLSLGGDEIAGYKMKNTSGWYNSKKYRGSNESGFSAEPFSRRDAGGSFSIWKYDDIRYRCDAQFWTSSINDYMINDAYFIFLTFWNDDAFKHNDSVGNGMSVRCVKD
jgi:uncharacterized protein (TIGR02145 family)